MTLIKGFIYSYDLVLEAIYQPLLDIYETCDDIIVAIDLPGVNINDILIKVFEDLLIIEGMKREPDKGNKLRYICMERNFGGFRRMIRLPVPVNSAGGRAVYSEGVLKLIFPKIKERLIKIKIER